MLATTTMASLGLALLLVSVAFVAYELITFRATMVRTHARAGLSPASTSPIRPAGGPHAFQSDRLVMPREIVFDNAPIGQVVIESDLGEMTTRLQRYALIVAAVMTLSFVLAYGTASRLHDRRTAS